jgi:hypothetical protein
MNKEEKEKREKREIISYFTLPPISSSRQSASFNSVSWLGYSKISLTASFHNLPIDQSMQTPCLILEL